MASGGMDQTSIISLLAFGLSFATFIVIRLNRRDEIADEQPNGDWPHVPEELRPARNSGRGESEQGGRAGTHRVIAHDKAGL